MTFCIYIHLEKSKFLTRHFRLNYLLCNKGIIYSDFSPNKWLVWYINPFYFFHKFKKKVSLHLVWSGSSFFNDKLRICLLCVNLVWTLCITFTNVCKFTRVILRTSVNCLRIKGFRYIYHAVSPSSTKLERRLAIVY